MRLDYDLSSSFKFQPLDLNHLCQNQCDRVFDHAPNRTPSMLPISITTTGIAKLLDNLKLHKAARPDGIFPWSSGSCSQQ